MSQVAESLCNFESLLMWMLPSNRLLNNLLALPCEKIKEHYMVELDQILEKN